MRHWQGLSQLFGRAGSEKPNTLPGYEKVLVQVHYRNPSSMEVIDDFRVSGGRSFFLTFLEGGTVDVNLAHVREIVFENMTGYYSSGHSADIPNYRVRVALRNGRTLKGHSVGLYSFSGIKDGIEWMHSFQGKTPDKIEAQQNLTRIVVREVHGAI